MRPVSFRSLLLGAGLFSLGYVAAAQKDHVRVSSAEAPARPGAPYSQAVMVGDLVWVSGNIGQDPKTLAVNPDFEAETRQAISNIGSILKAGGLTWADVVKTNVYVTDVSKYDAFNKVYVELLPKPLPARTFIGAAALPGGAQVEIEVVAARKR
jgi:2-iminobutanoate/2-iminopropanoate deaminase